MIAIEISDAWRETAATAGRIVLIVVVAFIASRLLRRAIGRVTVRMRQAAAEVRDRAPSAMLRAQASQRAEARAASLSSVLKGLVALGVWTTAVFMVLGELEVNLAPLIAGAGVASIAIGFGAQSLVRDVVTGTFILLEDQFGVGDIIDVGVATGTVERITLRTTQLRDVAGTVWHVPNGAIIRVGNKSQNWARAVVDITVEGDADVRRARHVVRRVADELVVDPEWSARISGAPDEQGVQAITVDGITLRTVVDTEPASQWGVERELRLRIKEGLDAEGILLATTIHHPRADGS
ncbi:MAG TPA: mechanosensitive ion channel family protein [Microthrixaceae bacterium]|nr:mechanosensitive ion channel family protein [Microthrixaceae bacterium]